jgi:hypothetical protein
MIFWGVAELAIFSLTSFYPEADRLAPTNGLKVGVQFQGVPLKRRQSGDCFEVTG